MSCWNDERTTGPRQLVERSAKALVVVTTKQKLDRILLDPRQMVHGHHEGSVGDEQLTWLVVTGT
jgi:hypothetical protein